MTRPPGPPLVFLGFGKYARADRIYAIQPIEGEDRGPGRRTLVWVEGLAEPIVASRSEGAIMRDMGPGRATLSSDLATDALALLKDLVDSVGAVGPILRREIRSEAGLDLDDLEGRSRRVLERTTGSDDDSEALF